MANHLMSKPASAPSRFSEELFAFSNPSSASSANFVTAWPEYMVDAFQRNVLFLDLLRQRGNEEIEITSRPMSTVLRFDYEALMSGLSLRSADQLCALSHHAAARCRDRPAQTTGRGGGSAGWSRARHRRVQDRKRNRRRSECGPSGLLHRIWRHAGAWPAVPGCRRGAGEVFRTGG